MRMESKGEQEFARLKRGMVVQAEKIATEREWFKEARAAPFTPYPPASTKSLAKPVRGYLAKAVDLDFTEFLSLPQFLHL